ncbi:MAG: helix-turn-helix domain-containing protein [Lachnospiraceae bacterium]
MTDLDFKTIGLKIKERRQAVGITQEHIANILGVNPSHISNIECGRAHPSLSALIKIANILQCSVDYFISGEYFYQIDKEKEKTLDDQILNKLKYCDIETKTKILKMIDILS